MSGEGIWLSADAAGRIVEEENLLTAEFKKSVPDDVAIGAILRHMPPRELASFVMNRSMLKATSSGLLDIPHLVTCVTDAEAYQVRLNDPEDRAMDLLLIQYLTQKFYPVELQHEDEYASVYAATVSTKPAKARVVPKENQAERNLNPQVEATLILKPQRNLDPQVAGNLNPQVERNLNPQVAAVLRGCGGVIRGPKAGDPKR